MKKEFLKKVMALELAGAMMLGMSTTAWAEDAPVLKDLTVPVTKTIYFFNDKGDTVYEPNVTYTFTLSAPKDAQINGATITDGSGDKVAVKAGTAEAIKTGTSTVNYKATHAKVEVDATNGAAVTKSGNLVIDPTGFKFNDEGIVDKTNGVLRAGVYRYIITETVKVGDNANADVTAAGLTARSDYQNTRILDIYVTNSGTTTPVILDEPAGPDKKVDGKGTEGDLKDDDPSKTQGFGDEPKPGEKDKDNENQPSKTEKGDSTNSFAGKANDGTVDRYTTYHMTVQKTVGGTMGDKSNKFPFQVDIANSIATNKFDYSFANGTATEVTVGTNADATIGSATASGTVTLKDGEQIVLMGVPTNQSANNGATAKINEYNNTKDKYTTSATNYTLAKDTLDGGSASENTATVKVSEEKDVVITNTLNEVSPTGVALRFAPYLLILAGAFFLVAFTRRRRVEE